MSGMGQHTDLQAAAAAPLRRGRAWAWIVFWSMAGTSVLYNVYHALVIGHMPWYTGVPEGVVPLLLSIGVLEIATVWPGWKSQAVAWSVTAGAMAWSAAATGAVVAPGAPGHVGFPFGLLADAAALFAVGFLLNGPTASRAAAELTALAGAERSAREQAEAAHRRAAREQAAAHAGQLGELRADLEGARGELEAARREAAEAREQAVKLAAQAVGARAPRKRAKAPAHASARAAGSAQDDMTNELRALMEFRADPRLLGEGMGSELGRKLGVHPSTGRRLHERMVGAGRLKPEYEAMAAPLAGGAESRELPAHGGARGPCARPPRGTREGAQRGSCAASVRGSTRSSRSCSRSFSGRATKII